MFTGIIEDLGKITSLKKLDGGLEFSVHSKLAPGLEIDDSISINGVCHTVTSKDEGTFTVQSVDETLRKTTMGSLAEGHEVNLETSLTMEKKLDGHIVQGHVDAVGTIRSITKEGTDWLIKIAYPEEFRGLIVGRGSIAIDGISLTVARDLDDSFMVAIIPYTLEHTNLKHKNEGDGVNLEFDILGKYVVKNLRLGNPESK